MLSMCWGYRATVSEETNSLDDADSFKKRDVRNWTEQASKNVSIL